VVIETLTMVETNVLAVIFGLDTSIISGLIPDLRLYASELLLCTTQSGCLLAFMVDQSADEKSARHADSTTMRSVVIALSEPQSGVDLKC